jgi:lipoprotein-anchoring transpeptidase ErfK/SrfK
MKLHATRLAALTVATAAFLAAANASAFTAADPAGSSVKRSDVVLAASQKKPPQKYWRTKVRFRTDEAPGTIIVDTGAKFLYYVLGDGQALRYGIGVGKAGFEWHGSAHVERKREWPDWSAPPQMMVRERNRGHIIPAHMEGGLMNPLGARALYLFNDKGDTGYRLHGSPEWWSIGKAVSAGCIRLMNQDIIDLYDRAPIGTKVIVI